MSDEIAKTDETPAQPDEPKAPNRFLYHVSGIGSFGNQIVPLSDVVVMSAPIDHPKHIREIERLLASKIHTQGPNGARLVGVRSTFALGSFALLRFWYDEAPISPGDKATVPAETPANEQPDRPLTVVHVVH